MTDETLERIHKERAGTHGDYAEECRVTQGVIELLRSGCNWPALPPIMRESLSLIALKMGRVVTGNPYVHEHWNDVKGYANLIVQRTDDGVPGVRAPRREEQEPERGFLEREFTVADAETDLSSVAQRFVDQFRSGSRGATMDADAAQALAMYLERALAQNATMVVESYEVHPRMVPRFPAEDDGVIYDESGFSSGAGVAKLQISAAEWETLTPMAREAYFFKPSHDGTGGRYCLRPADRGGARYPTEVNTKELEMLPLDVQPLYSWIDDEFKWRMDEKHRERWARP